MQHPEYQGRFIEETEAVTRRSSVKKVLLKISQNSQKNTFIKKETAAQVFSCGFCEIFRNSFFKEHLEWLHLKKS